MFSKHFPNRLHCRENYSHPEKRGIIHQSGLALTEATYLTLVQTLVGYTCKDVEERLLPLSACSRAHLCVHCGQARDPDPILRRKYGAKSTHRGCEQCFDCYKNSTMSWHCTLRIATFVTNKGRKRNENPPTGPQNSQTEF